MSHLAHMVKLKAALESAGVTCAVAHSHVIQEAFVRCLLTQATRTGESHFTTAVQNKAWNQLDKWNKVTPINAAYIVQLAKTRMNVLVGALRDTGSLPCPKEFTTLVKTATGVEVDFTSDPSFCELVFFLKKEFEGCYE